MQTHSSQFLPVDQSTSPVPPHQPSQPVPVGTVAMAARWADGRTVTVDVSVLASHVIEIATPRFYVRCQLTEDGAVLSFDLVQLSLRAPASFPSFVLTEQP